MKLKQTFLILITLLLATSVFCQNNFRYPISVQSKQISGSTIDTLRTVANKVLYDNIDLKTVVVSKADSNYQKPGSYVTTFDFKNQAVSKSNTLRVLQAAGSNIKVLPVLEGVYASTGSLADGSAYGTMLTYISDSVYMTGFVYILRTAGDFTADQTNGIALYKVNGANYDFVVQTPADATGALWKGTVDIPLQKALSAPMWITPGLYYTICLYNSSAQVTAPVLASIDIGTGFSRIAEPHMLGASWGTTTSFPAQKVASTTTRTANYRFIAIY